MTRTDWNETPATLEATFSFDDYLAGAAFAMKVADAAEGMDHHPEIVISYRKVTITTTTHDAGAQVTAKDRELAAAIDRLTA